MKKIPIQAAKDISKKYNQSQVILVTFDKNTGLTHVVSYGQTVEDCELASIGADFLKKAMGFPDDKCNDVPARAKRKGK